MLKMKLSEYNNKTSMPSFHRIVLLILVVCLLLPACGGGKKSPKTSSKDSLFADSVPSNYDPHQRNERIIKPVFMVRNNHIDWDTVSSYLMIDHFADDMEKLSLFYGIRYNDNYAQIKFENNKLVVGNDTLYMYHQQRIVGSYMTDSSWQKHIEYLIIHDSGDYSEEIDIISVDPTGKIIDFVELMSVGGDGGDNYERILKRIDHTNYKIRDLAIHETDTDTFFIDRDIIYRVTINVDGTFSKKEISNKKPYKRIVTKIESNDDWENLWSNF